MLFLLHLLSFRQFMFFLRMAFYRVDIGNCLTCSSPPRQRVPASLWRASVNVELATGHNFLRGKCGPKRPVIFSPSLWSQFLQRVQLTKLLPKRFREMLAMDCMDDHCGHNIPVIFVWGSNDRANYDRPPAISLLGTLLACTVASVKN